jgi:hypothetical protein
VNPGQRVIWWKRVSGSGRQGYPIRATVLAVTDRRVRIEAECRDGDSTPIIRHVAPEHLQEIRAYFYKSPGERSIELEPMRSWGAFCRYGQIAEDLYISRQVDVFENGFALSYDRNYWCDDFGMLGGLRFCRRQWEEAWGPLIEIDRPTFEQLWQDSQLSPLKDLQLRSTSRMSPMGATPPWIKSA